MIRFVKSFALVSASSVITLLLCETLLQVFPGVLPIEVQHALNDKGSVHAEIGNLPDPRSSGVILTHDFASPYQLDANGFRNDSDWPQHVDIAVVGDSLVFGYGVDAESAWPQVLSKMTGKNVVNLGLIGASPQQYRKIHQTFVRPLMPEIVVIGFFARNDFWDADQYAAWERSGVGGNYLEWRGFGRPTAEQYQNPLYRIFFELRKRSYLLALIKFGRDALFIDASAPPTELVVATGSRLLLHLEDFQYKTSLSGADNDTFDLVVDEFRQIRDMTTLVGTRLIVLLQPAKEEVYREGESGPFPDASAVLRDSLEQLGIEFIDATPAFRRLAREGVVLYFSTDGHPNARGYAVLAELVAKYLGASGIQSADR